MHTAIRAGTLSQRLARGSLTLQPLMHRTAEWPTAIRLGRATKMAAELIIANLRGGTAEREAAYTELLWREEEHNANADAAPVATAATRAEELQALKLSELRARALMADYTEEDVAAAMDDTEDPKAALVQLLLSHGTRSEEDPESLATIAVACASPLCEVLGKAASEVDAAEWHRVAQVLTVVSSVDPARVGGECVKPDQCNLFTAWMAPDSVLGVGESYNIIHAVTFSLLGTSLTDRCQPQCWQRTRRRSRPRTRSLSAGRTRPFRCSGAPPAAVARASGPLASGPWTFSACGCRPASY
eukprot:COSAG02_NODE_438_length_22319_cov_17.198425_19_plen_301_part_00